MNEDWIINADELTFGERISEGSFGVVYIGTYRNSLVAIKIMKTMNSDDESFQNEV